VTPEIRILDQGERVLFRAVEPGDKDLLRAGFDALTREARYQRFSMPKAKLTPEELAFYTEMDGVRHFAVAAGRIDENDQPIEGIGIARYVSLPDAENTAEIAIVVLDAYQNRGIGTSLLELVLLEATRNGIEHMVAHVQRSNRTAMLLIEKCVERFDVHLEGSYRAFTWDL